MEIHLEVYFSGDGKNSLYDDVTPIDLNINWSSLIDFHAKAFSLVCGDTRERGTAAVVVEKFEGGEMSDENRPAERLLCDG